MELVACAEVRAPNRLPLSRRGLLLLVLLIGLGALPHQGGVPLLMVAGVGALVVADAVACRLGASRVRVGLSCGTDAVVGRPFAIRLRVDGRRSTTIATFDASTILALSVPFDGVIHDAWHERGVQHGLSFSLAWFGPLGIGQRHRSYVATFAEQVDVGPSPEAVRDQEALATVVEGEVTEPHRSPLGVPAPSVRTYQPGDQPRLVHWPATARTGELVVRELEQDTLPTLVVVAELSPPGPAAERAARRAAGLCEQAIARGAPVRLITAEGDQVVEGLVDRPVEVARRLARAGPAPLRGRIVADPGIRWVSP